jgi:ATP-binding cassette, subfamily C, bacterial EexD
MQQMIRSWIKYVMVAGIFSTALNLVFLAVPLYMLVVYDRVLFSFSEATLVTLGIGVIISLVVMQGLDYIRNRMLIQAGNDLVQKMTPLVVASMQADAAAPSTGTYHRGLEDLETLRDAIARGRMFYYLDFPWVLVYLFVLYLMNPLVGMIAGAGVLMAVMFRLLLRMLEKQRYTIADVGLTENQALVKTGVNHAELVTALGMAEGIADIYRSRYDRLLKIKSEAEGFHAGIGAVIRFVHHIFLTGVFTAGVWAFFKDDVTGGMIVAGVIMAARIMVPLEQGLGGMKASIDAVNAGKRLKTLVQSEPAGEKISLPEPVGKVDVQGLSLGVSGKTLLRQINLDLEPGEILGVIGPCEAGKTVLCRVLTGIWPAGAGEVLLDGARINQWPKEELGRYIGYMPQVPDLLPGTVAENIARFTGGASEKVIQAARTAGVHDVILKLPQGYDTPVVQSGRHLSAGRRQLISLARALYGPPRFMVMDEPHSFLDDAGLKILQTVLDTLKQERITTVMVTDRPSILMNMDKLLVIREGQTAMYGPAKDVMAQLANRQQPRPQKAGE